MRAGWQTQIDFGVANPSLFRLLTDPEGLARSPSAKPGRRVLEARVRRVAETGRLRVSEQRAVDLIQATGAGTIQTLLSTPLEHHDPVLAEGIYEAVLAHILADPPERAQKGAIATTVAFRPIAPRLGMLTDAERQLLADWLDRAIEALQWDPSGRLWNSRTDAEEPA